MTKLNIGCAGWDYSDWRGTFYPKNLKRQNYLNYYSKFFDCIEINTTFYNIPSEETVHNWLKQVPVYFKFSIKVWQNITHNTNNLEIESIINLFFSRMKILESKIAGYLIQFPPRFSPTVKHINYLSKIIEKLPAESRYFLEFRYNSWFNPKILAQFLDSSRIFLATSYMKRVQQYYYPEQDYYYIRLLGDHQLTVFNRIQRNQDEALEDLSQNINSLQKSPKVKEIIIIFNNNFRGFSPEDANEFKKKLGLHYHPFPKQRNLFDFV